MDISTALSLCTEIMYFCGMINVYRILNVPATATDAEIKAAYKKLSRELHPDHGGDPEAMARLNEAYNLINTTEKRKKYDSANAFGTSFRQWETIFGKSDVAKNFGNAPSSEAPGVRGSDIKLNVNIPLKSFFSGERFMSVKYEKRLECLECSGTGIHSKHKCPVCGGTGKVRKVTLDCRDQVMKCTSCDGTGEVVKERCEACSGEGYSVKQCTHSFTYAPKMLKMCVTGKGNEGSCGGENGNLDIAFIPGDDGVSYHDQAFWMEMGIHPEDFLLGVTVDFDFGGKMVVYHLEPQLTFDAKVAIPNVCGTEMPLNLHFFLKSEEQGDIARIHDALHELRAAREGEKD